MSRRWLVVPVLLALPLLMAHGDGCSCGGDEAGLGDPTGASCPTPSTLTYENFGRAFMDSYCVECHDSALTGADRQGAPSFHDFDTVEGIRNVADHIDQMSGSGPDATNTRMPESDPKPSLAERQMLSAWIACGAP